MNVLVQCFYMKWYHHYEIIIIYFKIYISHFQLSVNKTSLWCTSNTGPSLCNITDNFTDICSSCLSMHYAVSFHINILLQIRHDYKYEYVFTIDNECCHSMKCSANPLSVKHPSNLLIKDKQTHKQRYALPVL